MTFSPIAIVGQACVLPGALSPEELLQVVHQRRSSISSPPAGHWRIDPQRMFAPPGRPVPDRTWSDQGGYVRGFESVFNPAGFLRSAAEIRQLDVLFHWCLHISRQALAQTSRSADMPAERKGLILGNLAYPCAEFSRYAESILSARAGLPFGPVHAFNRFHSGQLASYTAACLGLGGDAFCLDAACASSLYAVKLACDALHDGRLDLVLAGGACRADDLFLHVGFSMLNALSKSGRSQPFCNDADGLVPAEGAALVALKRLEDALADGDRILGLIRGVGLSNDGSSGGMLTPSFDGQVRAMRQAYAQSGLEPADLSLVECHATGTTVGDGVELRSLSELLAGSSASRRAHKKVRLPISSLKSNMGHLLAAAGAAGLIKVLKSFECRLLPPTLVAGPLRDELQHGPQTLRVVESAAEWRSDKPRLAAVNGFGFGGANAHLIVEEWVDADPKTVRAPIRIRAPMQQCVTLPLAIVGIAAQVADGADLAAFEASLFEGNARQPPQPMRRILLDAHGLRFPPRDLEHCLPQQLLALKVARDAAAGVAGLPDQTGVYVGMACDAEISRFGMKWRLPALLDEAAIEGLDDSAVLEQWRSFRDSLGRPLDSAAVVGTMPNIPANRINIQLDLHGPGFTVSADELSGIRALQTAARAVRSGEVEAAIVCAVDLCCEEIHIQAAAEILPGNQRIPGDAGIALVLKPVERALRDGDVIYALLGVDESSAPSSPQLDLQLGADDDGLTPRFGHAHAASGLLHVVAAVLAIHRRRLPAYSGQESEAWRTFEPRTACVRIEALGGQSATVHLREAPAHAPNKKLTPTGQSHSARFLEFPAHAPPVQFPTDIPRVVHRPSALREESGVVLKSSSASTANVPQVMRCAPELAAILSQTQAADAPATLRIAQAIIPRSPVAQAPIASASLATTSRSPASEALSSVGPDASSAHAAAVVNLVRRASDVQRDFISRLQASQRQFLAMRERFAESRAASSTSFADPLPAPLPREAEAHGPIGFADESHPFIPSPEGNEKVRQIDEPTERTLRKPTGPSYSRQQLEVLASGQISSVFGTLFERQDGYARQVRMPMPPLLLADRVTGIDAEPGVEGLGTIWTETDVRWDSWYLDVGVMPAGIMIESGQADLLLISWMGADFKNQDRRVYRLLGCEATFSGGLPRPGDTLRFEIRILGHAKQGAVRLFFFEYDCWIGDELRLQVRHGQAGFFSDEELAGSDGVIWSPESSVPPADTPAPAQPRVRIEHSQFDSRQVDGFFAGRMIDCFGSGFEPALAHVRTPTTGRSMPLFTEVTRFDPSGGPWNRGYLRAVRNIVPDDWFFQGHFKNDPCMPGTLMAEGSLQAMAFYLAGLGYTLDKDGWRFEPVPNAVYQFRCRGQLIPQSKQLVYELFVEEVQAGPEPVLFADILCTVDGVKAFHARRMGLKLVPDWPLNDRPELLAEGAGRQHRPVANVDDVSGDYHSLIACAWGRPSEAFGEMYRIFDGHRRAPRLPGPPYHFMSRITRMDAARGVPRVGSSIEAEYDVPPDAWYFQANGNPTLPFCVLQEINLQPCGWLATLSGTTLRAREDLYFRNLDGKGDVCAEILPGETTLRTRVELTRESTFGGTTIVMFKTECHSGDRRICWFETSFGFFTAAALSQQVGIPADDAERRAIAEPHEFVECVRAESSALRRGRLKLPEPMLCMFDRITGYWPTGGQAGLGRVRAEQTVDPSAWYFKAHFYQDPVQPGSLGVQGLLNLLQGCMLLKNLAAGIANPRFEPIALDTPIVWKYRGQIVPTNLLAKFELELFEIGRDDDGVFALATGAVWVDGVRIYQVERLGMRIVSDSELNSSRSGTDCDVATANIDVDEWLLDTRLEPWLLDHCPTFTIPTAPLMWIADAMARVANARQPELKVVAVEDLQLLRWLPVAEPAKLSFRTTDLPRSTTNGRQCLHVELSMVVPDPVQAISNLIVIATARILLGSDYAPNVKPQELSSSLQRMESPYLAPTVFHGPAFQVVRELWSGRAEAVCNLGADEGGIPCGLLNIALLDGALHAIPHANLETWSTDIPAGHVAFPLLLKSLEFYSAPPTAGLVQSFVRLDRFDNQRNLAWFQFELQQNANVICRFELAEVVVGKGPFQQATMNELRSFFAQRLPVPGLRMSSAAAGRTELSIRDVGLSDWLPGTLAQVYQCHGRHDQLAAGIAVKEHLSTRLGVHPSEIKFDETAQQAYHRSDPNNRCPVQLLFEHGLVIVTDA